jgi:hypothetical protein
MTLSSSRKAVIFPTLSPTSRTAAARSAAAAGAVHRAFVLLDFEIIALFTFCNQGETGLPSVRCAKSADLLHLSAHR